MTSDNPPPPQIRWWYSSERKRLISAVTVVEDELLALPNASQVTDPPLDPWNWKWRAIAALLGMMGATLSGILSVARNSIQGRIPDLLLNWRVTMAKLVVGAISALALQTAPVSGTLKIQDAAATQGSVMLVAFAAGFTERLVERAIETVAPSSKS
jgi:hypothetical protein